jgi:WD40 repeat protein
MPLAAGQRLGPYEILELVGAGGMGEVYRARDPRLGRDVAVKVLPAEMGADPERLRRFEQEARAVAALNHPNILTVFDVGTHEGTPYVVMELLQGETLREMALRRAPTQRQVLSFAVQAAQGLEAAHAKGIVHRDLKPENVFVTTDGRVKLLDFGLATQARRLTAGSVESTASSPTDAGALVGTVGYMSPEQARGLSVDVRTDVFSFGVVLYEVLAGTHPFRRETTVGTLTAILEEEPAELTTLGRGIPPALSGIVRRCLEKGREERYPSAHEVVVALEAVQAAPAGSASLQEVEERSPYPGLSSFTEKDAARFFGREAEVRALWQRLQSRKLLAVIGPSGAGKSSFLRAGVIPARPEGWSTACATPGGNPALGLARALTPAMAGDAEAMGEILAGVGELTQDGKDDRLVGAVKRWRARQPEALLVIDQFEELFTLTPPETQERFAAFLGRLVGEADVHVALSLRDDFLMRCHDRPALVPVFTELTPLGALTAEGLRRAVVEPARKLGYRFEDEALVDEMVESVEGARGALPLLAFAVSRLWEKRDRQRKLLTRAAYEEIGGVAGALAQHAEATMDRIGPERQNVVREIFRNLVTAQGTRAVAEREELLSAFPHKREAEEVLRQLIDARLVTSYEIRHAEGVSGPAPEESAAGQRATDGATHRVEVVHESLLKAWPRLVRWQAQDEEGAVLRDQLKQAAHLWEEKGRTSDLLWTGTAFQEYVLWRDRYAGALTALEEDFARAMAERAQRQRRFRRLVAASIVAAALVVAGVTGVLWRRSEAARERARAEALRAEAGKLLALARTHLEDDRTAALAYARGSLDLSDTPEARRFVLEVLWRGPVARVLDVKEVARALHLPEAASYFGRPVFSPDGRWMTRRENLLLLFDRDGGPPRALPPEPDTKGWVVGFGPRSDLLVSMGAGHSLRLCSLPELREIRTVSLGAGLSSYGRVQGGKVVVTTRLSQNGDSVFQVLDLPDGTPRVVTAPTRDELFWEGADARGGYAVVTRGRTVGLRSLDGSDRLRVIGETQDDPYYAAYTLNGDLVAATDGSGEARLWSTGDGASRLVRVFRGPEFAAQSFAIFDSQGRRLSQVGPNGTHTVWDLETFPDARPLVVGRPGPNLWRQGAFDPTGQWLALGDNQQRTVELWPVSSPRRRVVPGFAAASRLAFTPDSRWLATCPYSRPARLWPVSTKEGMLRGLEPPGPCASLAIDPAGRSVLVGTEQGQVLLYPFTGGPPRELFGGWAQVYMSVASFDSRGERVVASPGSGLGVEPESRLLRLWDLRSGREQVHSVAHLTEREWAGYLYLEFAPDGRAYASGPGGVRRLSLPSEPGGTVSAETVYAAGAAQAGLSLDGRALLVSATRSLGLRGPYEELLLLDLAADSSRRITTHGSRLAGGRLSPSGRILVTGDVDGVVRVGPVTGDEPHLLLGHKGPISSLAVSPDEKWIASSSDESISIWPMPDVTRPPLHTLPHAELLAKLDALTNLRVVRDPASATGWTLEIGPFPGWKDVPTW